MIFKSIDEIPGVARGDTAKGRAAFAAGEARLLVLPLNMSEGARDAFAQLTSEQMGKSGNTWRRRSRRPDAYSLFDTGGDWGHDGDMCETHIRLQGDKAAQAGRLARQIGSALYSDHPGGTDAGKTMSQLARTFAKLAGPQHNLMLYLVYGFDHAPGPCLLPQDAASRRYWEKLAQEKPSRVSTSHYKMEVILHGPGLIILADDPARHGWIAPDSSYHCDSDGDHAQWWKKQKQCEQEAQQALIERFGAALVPVGHMVITRADVKLPTYPVVMAQERWEQKRGVSASGSIYSVTR